MTRVGGTNALHRVPLPRGPQRQSDVESVPQCWHCFLSVSPLVPWVGWLKGRTTTLRRLLQVTWGCHTANWAPLDMVTTDLLLWRICRAAAEKSDKARFLFMATGGEGGGDNSWDDVGDAGSERVPSPLARSAGGGSNQSTRGRRGGTVGGKQGQRAALALGPVGVVRLGRVPLALTWCGRGVGASGRRNMCWRRPCRGGSSGMGWLLAEVHISRLQNGVCCCVGRTPSLVSSLLGST